MTDNNNTPDSEQSDLTPAEKIPVSQYWTEMYKIAKSMHESATNMVEVQRLAKEWKQRHNSAEKPEAPPADDTEMPDEPEATDGQAN